MKGASTLLRWALPRTPSERRRWLLTAFAVAVWAVTALLAVAVSRTRLATAGVAAMAEDGRVLSVVDPKEGLMGYSELLHDENRLGFLLAIVLTSVAPLTLAWQAVRLGSVDRARRLVQLRTAGATPGQLRFLACLESATAAVIGAALGLLAITGLAALTPSLPVDARVVPPLDAWTAPSALAVGALAAGLAAAAGAWTLRGAAVRPAAAPEGRPQVSPARTLPASRAWAAGVTLLLSVSLPAVYLSGTIEGDAVPFVVIAVVTAFAFTAAPYGSLAVAAGLERRGDAVGLLAAARLRADPRTPARAAAVLFVAGGTLTGAVLSAVDVAVTTEPGSRPFYLVGSALAVIAAAVAALTAGIATLVGAAEQLATGRRAFAALSAFGVTPRQLRRSLRWQTTAVSTVCGQVGCLFVTVPVVVAQPWQEWQVWASLPACHLLVACLTWLGGGLVVAVLGPQVRAALDPSVLRTA